MIFYALNMLNDEGLVIGCVDVIRIMYWRAMVIRQKHTLSFQNLFKHVGYDLYEFQCTKSCLGTLRMRVELGFGD